MSEQPKILSKELVRGDPLLIVYQIFVCSFYNWIFVTYRFFFLVFQIFLAVVLEMSVIQ